jgi:murein DD-endopeptidase MepM/ murein hydrolase activator NlpD
MKPRQWFRVWLGILHLAAGTAAIANGREISQGEIIEVKVTAEDFIAVSGRIGSENIHFSPNGQGEYTAIVGIDLEAKPGPLKIAVKGTTLSGDRRETHLTLEIKEKAFPKEELSVAAEFDRLTAEVKERIRREQQQYSRVFAASLANRLWEAPFIEPVAGKITSPFGFRRIVNGMPRAPHTGVDLRAPIGTEVVAANHGRVVLLADFFFSGKSLILDHGGGLFTMYFHLSEFKVGEGALVRKGDIIALSGMSGRVTGPHLHWGARLNNARVDPLELIEKLGGQAGQMKPAVQSVEFVR